MPTQESNPILPNSPENLRSFEAQYPGIFDLRVLPEVTSMQAAPHPDGSFDLTVVSADGYTLLYTLRKPNEHDFNGDTQSQQEAIKENYLTMEGMRLTHAHGTIDILSLLRQAEERIVNGHKNSYTIAASKPKHLPRLPVQYLERQNYSPDSVAAEQVAADIIRNNVYMDEGRFNERTNSIRSRLPVGDLSLYMLVHEATHSLDMQSQNNTLKPYAAHPKLKPVYKQIDQITQDIKINNDEYSAVDVLHIRMETENPDNPELDGLFNQMLKLKNRGEVLGKMLSDLWKFTDRERHILSERNGHVPALREAEALLNKLGLSRNRLKRMRIFERFVLYSYQKNLEEIREKYPLPNMDSGDFVYIPNARLPLYEDILQKVKDFTKDTP